MKKLFKKKKKKDGKFLASETGITVALAEHLMKKLAPGPSYKVDAYSHKQKACLCGCGQTPNFSETGIGMTFILSFII